MVVRTEVLLKWLRVLRSLAEGYPVESELRGWSWQFPPVRPRSYLGLAVQDAASYCPTKRDVWLRRVAGVRVQPTPSMKLGSVVHDVVFSVVSVVRKYVSVGLDFEKLSRAIGRAIELKSRECPSDECVKIARSIGWLTYYTATSEWLWSSSGVIPTPATAALSEVRVDGSPIGLSSSLRIDSLPIPNVVVDIKTGRKTEVHELSLAAYALALESTLETPVDFGILVYVWWNSSLQVDIRGVYIGPDLRRVFLDSRDEAIDIVLSRREPPKAAECPQTCPYLEVCEHENTRS
ncbi:MAG: type I-A CRISPR-associated protein Cas4/Csa1 [Sulfolobales archaeon]|nr:type I-A CRISPR-associated protein Cas4/Csa1 [Sulfolobales archaeon]MDW8082549.1 type I-A CRISPR-associated protein Cas4/Csa1 [Sulfolobales archaeon]